MRLDSILLKDYHSLWKTPRFKLVSQHADLDPFQNGPLWESLFASGFAPPPSSDLFI